MLNHQLQFHTRGTSEPATFAFTKSSPVHRDCKTNSTANATTRVAFDENSELEIEHAFLAITRWHSVTPYNSHRSIITT